MPQINKSLTSAFLSVLLITGLLGNIVTPTLAEEISISGNGDSSQSSMTINYSPSTSINQSNSMTINNEVNSSATTGSNEASGNSGTTTITTGDIDENISVENSGNNSVVESGCCVGDSSYSITGNGTSSGNTINYSDSQSTTINTYNSANITNTINSTLTTGENTASGNMGQVSIQTGNINSNIKILNGPVNYYSVSSSSGGPLVLASINGNGGGSINNINAAHGGDTIVNAGNALALANQINWNAVTGGNSANGNSGGVNISTGNAFLDLVIKNFANFGFIKINNCCQEPVNPPLPTPTSTPVSSPTPSSTPTPGSSSGGTSGGSSGGSGVGGGPAILGLSFTGTSNQNIPALFAGIMISALFIVLKKNIKLGSKEKRKVIGILSIIILGGILSLAWDKHTESKVAKAMEPISVQGFDVSEDETEKEPVRIVIPQISLDIPVKKANIVKGYWEVFEDVAAWGDDSGYPGQTGNQVIFAHAREGLFLNLPEVVPGTRIYVYTNNSYYTYEIKETKEVFPNQIEVVAPTPDETLTLYTCSGYKDSKRFVVIAKKI